ncbi:rhamnogalacturonase a [Seiridium cupressi]
MRLFLAALLAATYYVPPVVAQLSGSVGPTTSTASKAAKKICNIMDYGGVSSATTDNSAAITSAWSACKSGGQVYIPAGNYGLSTWVTLSGGTGVSINLEGIIYRIGTAGGNMFAISTTTDFEFYSANSEGAIQGYGYELNSGGASGPRLIRLISVTDFSLHDIALVDAPVFHLVLDTCTNGEVYNAIIHGAYEGGLDGIDVWGTNIWFHDIEVSNKDECVTVKNPASNILVEQIHCNWSGGSAMGSLSTGIDIHDIEYNYIYTHHSNQMYMFKSNGGSGTVKNILLNNFSGHSNAYTLDLDSAWSSMSEVDGDGITYTNITFDNWKGTATNGVQRGPIKANCPSAVPCTDINIENFNVWTDTGSSVLWGCQNAYGSGGCLKSGSGGSYTSTSTVTSVSGYQYTTMSNELPSGFPVGQQIPIPSIPASFYPGRQPISAVLAKRDEPSPATVVEAKPSMTAASTITKVIKQTPVSDV